MKYRFKAFAETHLPIAHPKVKRQLDKSKDLRKHMQHLFVYLTSRGAIAKRPTLTKAKFTFDQYDRWSPEIALGFVWKYHDQPWFNQPYMTVPLELLHYEGEEQ